MRRRTRTAAVGDCEQVGAVRAHLDRAVEIGPEYLGTVRAQPFECRRRRVTVAVAPAHADHGDARPQLFEELLGGCRGAAVVGDFEHVEPVRRSLRGEAGGEQLRIDLLFHVARQQRPALAEVDVKHDRYVVDGLAAVGRVKWHAAGRRPVDVEANAVEP